MPGMIQPARSIHFRAVPLEDGTEAHEADVYVKSPAGANRMRTLPISPEQWEAWQGGQLIQNALPHLSAEDREWLMSGMDAEEWAAATAEPED